MSSIRYEAELLAPISKHLNYKGYRWQEAEVRFYDYRIDLYAYSRVNDQTIAIELKLRNWKKALSQSIVYQLCADIVYAALPKDVISESVIESFKLHGVGLIGVSDKHRCRQILQPGKSDEVRSWYRNELISNLTGKLHEHC